MGIMRSKVQIRVTRCSQLRGQEVGGIEAPAAASQKLCQLPGLMLRAEGFQVPRGFRALLWGHLQAWCPPSSRRTAESDGFPGCLVTSSEWLCEILTLARQDLTALTTSHPSSLSSLSTSSSSPSSSHHHYCHLDN